MVVGPLQWRPPPPQLSAFDIEKAKQQAKEQLASGKRASNFQQLDLLLNYLRNLWGAEAQVGKQPMPTDIQNALMFALSNPATLHISVATAMADPHREFMAWLVGNPNRFNLWWLKPLPRLANLANVVSLSPITDKDVAMEAFAMENKLQQWMGEVAKLKGPKITGVKMTFDEVLNALGKFHRLIVDGCNHRSTPQEMVASLRTFASKIRDLQTLCEIGRHQHSLSETSLLAWFDEMWVRINSKMVTSLDHCPELHAGANEYRMSDAAFRTAAANEEAGLIMAQFKAAQEAASAAALKLEKAKAMTDGADAFVPPPRIQRDKRREASTRDEPSKKSKDGSGKAATKKMVDEKKLFRDGTRVKDFEYNHKLAAPMSHDLPPVDLDKRERRDFQKCMTFMQGKECPLGDLCPRAHVHGRCFVAGEPYDKCRHFEADCPK